MSCIQLHSALVGLSGQVPGKIIFLTEGPSRKVKIGSQEIIFRKTTKKIMSSAGTREGLLIRFTDAGLVVTSGGYDRNSDGLACLRKYLSY